MKASGAPSIFTGSECQIMSPKSPNEKFPFDQVIVIGGTGQTGHRILELLVELGVPRIVATSREVKASLPAGPLASTVLGDAQKWTDKVEWYAVDLEAEADVLKPQLKALGAELNAQARTALVFAAAYTNVEGCETEPDKCRKINEANTTAVLYWAKKEFNAKLAFYSTDYVFDGKDGPYPETAPRNALCQYGLSKVYVEEWLERMAKDAIIMRTTGVYDYLPGSKNFLMQMLDLWGQGKQTRIPSDQLANPVWAFELAKATIELLAKDSKGIFHVAGGTFMPRTDFAKEIARVFGFDPALITGIRTEEMAQKAKRPLRGGLKCEKLKAELGWAPAPATAVLESLKWNRR